jgi:hypothetical protein
MSAAELAGDTLWTAQDVARFLRKSIRWVYGEAAIDAIPCRRIGGSLRFEPEAVRAWVRGDVLCPRRPAPLRRPRPPKNPPEG